MKQTGELYIADAYHGLCVVGPNGGEAKLIVREADGIPFSFTNDVVISSDGVVYFSDSSIKYQRR
jgi:sugar lactone lactonase YvrE